MPPLSPMRGIAYGALPCTSHGCSETGKPSEDMLQEAYSAQWGPEGRDDLGVMSRMGANAVRLYHSMGLDVETDHGKFLDQAQVAGLNVMPGYDTEQVHKGCPDFDCYDTWKQATLQAFQVGFKKGTRWHPAISTLVLLNEPDFFGSYMTCDPAGPWCRVKAMLSALDGVLAAEREAGVEAGRVRLSVTWSFAMMESIDGKEDGPGVFGFQDTVAGIADPSIAKYSPRSSQAQLEHAFKTRWVHGLNTQAPWSFVKEKVLAKYEQFAPIPWFIGEYGANGQTAASIQSDLEDMQRTAELEAGDTGFLGAAFFQFQTAYWKGGSEMNYGIFSLGAEKIGSVTPACFMAHCPAWPVHCLSTDLEQAGPELPAAMAHRAQAVAAAWQGSLEGGKGFCDGDATSTATVTTTTAELAETTTQELAESTQAVSTSRLPPGTLPPMFPLRGIAYGALPCTEPGCAATGWVNEDMLQEAYSKQWGAEGRDDLNTMVKLGANAVRLYHSFGLDVKHDHGGFLERAQELGLNVMPGYHTEAVHLKCPDFDCFEFWKSATLQGFQRGFQTGDQWHPAVSALILLNEPDFFGGYPNCAPSGAWCRVKALLSALDGVLAAEREAGVQAGRVRLTVTWSFGMMPSIDGKEGGPGLFGFEDTVAGMADPSLANYTPRSSHAQLQEAYNTRWAHGVNTQAPWSFVKQVIGGKYANLFSPIPWYIGEYGANGQSFETIQGDLEDMQRTAEDPSNDFMGAAFFQFQTAHFKGGSELNFGLFQLGSETLWEISPPCDIEAQLQPFKCPTTWPVHCLQADLTFLSGTMGHRAAAVAAAWHGSMARVESGPGFCKGTRRLSNDGTRIACQILRVKGGEAYVSRQLQGSDFSKQLATSTRSVLGNSSEAIHGDLLLESTQTATAEDGVDGDGGKSSGHGLKEWLPQILAGALLLVACVLAFWVFLSRKTRKAHQSGPTAYAESV